MWTDFDRETLHYLEATTKTAPVVCHIDQPVQADGRSFRHHLDDIFSQKVVCQEFEKNPPGGLLQKWLGMVFGRKDNVFYARLEEQNKTRFFQANGLGCFWHVLLIEKNHMENGIPTMSWENLIYDDFIHHEWVRFLLFRDYLNNRLSLATKERDQSLIEDWIDQQKIFMGHATLKNIFDLSYIDDLPHEKISLNAP